MMDYYDRIKLIKEIFTDLDKWDIAIINKIYEWEEKDIKNRNKYKLYKALREYDINPIKNRVKPGRLKKGSLLERGYIFKVAKPSSRKEKILYLEEKGMFVAFFINGKGRYALSFKRYGIDNNGLLLALFKVLCSYILDNYKKGAISKLDNEQLRNFITSHLYVSVFDYLNQITGVIPEAGDPNEIIRSSSPLFFTLGRAGLEEEEIKMIRKHLVEIDFLSQIKFEMNFIDKVLRLENAQNELNTISGIVNIGCAFFGFEGEIDSKKLLNDYFEDNEKLPLELRIKNISYDKSRVRESEYCPELKSCKPKKFEDMLNCERKRVNKQ